MKAKEATAIVRTYTTRQAAEFGQMLLSASGVQSFINADDGGDVQPFLAMTGSQLIVRTDELERADYVLKESEAKCTK